MSTLQVSNIHFESTANNRLQYTGSNSYNLVGGGITVATVNTTAISFPLGFSINNLIANNIYSGSGGTVLVANSTVVNATHLGGAAASLYQLNSTLTANVATRTANNTSFVGTVSAANVVSNAQLTANLANYTTTASLAANYVNTTAFSSNLANYTNTAALNSNLANYTTTTALTNNLANYQTTAGLSANVAKLTANNANNLGTVAASNYSRLDASGTHAARMTYSGSQTTGTMLNTTGSLGGLEIYGGGTANAAYMAFHRPGIYASYFGIDTDNQFAVGGWSAGAALGNMKVGSLGVGTTASGSAGSITATGAVSAGSLAGTAATGSGASGTWGISISGTAANATNLAGIAGTSYYRSGGTDVAIADGGTGASDAANARNNLGIGSMATRGVTITTSGSPTGGAAGDIWLQYVN